MRNTGFQLRVSRHLIFRERIWVTMGRGSMFRHCRFLRCDFQGAKWTGAEFISPEFEQCTGITFELCGQAKISDPKGLSAEVLSELNRMGPAGYQAVRAGEATPGPDGVEPTDGVAQDGRTTS